MEQSTNDHLNFRLFKPMTSCVACSLPLCPCSHLSVLFSFSHLISSTCFLFPTSLFPSRNSTLQFLSQELNVRFFLTSNQVWDISRILWITYRHRELPAIQLSQQVWRQVFTNVSLVMGHRNDKPNILPAFSPLPYRINNWKHRDTPLHNVKKILSQQARIGIKMLWWNQPNITRNKPASKLNTICNLNNVIILT